MDWKNAGKQNTSHYVFQKNKQAIKVCKNDTTMLIVHFVRKPYFRRSLFAEHVQNRLNIINEYTSMFSYDIIIYKIVTICHLEA